MNWPNAILFGFIATLLLTTTVNLGRNLGFTRMNLSFILGTLVTSNRDQANWKGFLIHLLNGWLISFLYISIFRATGLYHWWFGMLLGVIHTLFVLSVGMPLLPFIHPRMATEQQGPDSTRLLEPPGFFALHYGRGTPLVTLVSHLIFGGFLGCFYH